MFAARNPLKRPLLLGGLRVLCVRKNLQPRRAMSSCVTKCSRLFSSLFLQEDENISPILPISSALSKKEHFGNCPRINRMRTLLQNTGGGTAPATHSAQSLPFFPTANKCATRTNSRNLNRLMRLLHDFWIPGGGGYLAPSLLALFRFSCLDFRLFQDRQCKVTGPFIGCTIAAPVRRDSNKFAFNPKYHFAGRSASSINISRGLCFNPSACKIIVSWSCRKNFCANIRKIQTGSSKFHAATKSIRHRSRRTGVTVARLENHNFPLRISSVRIFGKTKSIVVVTGSPVYFCSILYGALFELGVCGLIRNPFGIGSNFFSFS